MASEKQQANGQRRPQPFDARLKLHDPSQLPDWDVEYIDEADLKAFADALSAPSAAAASVTALNDWRPIHQRVRRKDGARPRRRKAPPRSVDETREGNLYTLLKWPLLVTSLAWILGLVISYLLTRLYIWLYEHIVTWRGERESLRQSLRSQTTYMGWVKAAQTLDAHLGNDAWKHEDDYAYYDFTTVRRARDQLRAHRQQAARTSASSDVRHKAVEELRGLVEACARNSFAGTENPRLYSETYYGTKDLVQDFNDELARSLDFLLETPLIGVEEQTNLSRHIRTNLGRSALCLSGGATFAFYHFGVLKALLDADLLPDVIAGTSGGALVAALAATHTNDELRQLLVPALAHRITACEEPMSVWMRRWWKTGARFDSVDWARKCSWFCRGSMTFREAYERTGRILNITCIPSDPHSPAILANYQTAPDCVIWSAALASAAVPGILNPVVLMTKRPDGTLAPYSFGHKWKDGSLRTDIPLRSLNLHFHVNYSIVSQTNPHINLFFFGSRGAVGRPVTHRRGRGWRGGFVGSALEQYLKLDLNKWLKVLRHLELLPRWKGQDWSEIWLQPFSGTITIWPRTRVSDFLYILSDPTTERLERMLRAGASSTFPKLRFVGNRIRLERLVEKGLLRGPKAGMTRPESLSLHGEEIRQAVAAELDEAHSTGETMVHPRSPGGGVMAELQRQSGVFWDDPDGDFTEESAAEEEAFRSIEAGPTKVG